MDQPTREVYERTKAIYEAELTGLRDVYFVTGLSKIFTIQRVVPGPDLEPALLITDEGDVIPWDKVLYVAVHSE